MYIMSLLVTCNYLVLCIYTQYLRQRTALTVRQDQPESILESAEQLGNKQSEPVPYWTAAQQRQCHYNTVHQKAAYPHTHLWDEIPPLLRGCAHK